MNNEAEPHLAAQFGIRSNPDDHALFQVWREIGRQAGALGAQDIVRWASVTGGALTDAGLARRHLILLAACEAPRAAVATAALRVPALTGLPRRPASYTGPLSHRRDRAGRSA